MTLQRTFIRSWETKKINASILSVPTGSISHFEETCLAKWFPCQSQKLFIVVEPYIVFPTRMLDFLNFLLVLFTLHKHILTYIFSFTTPRMHLYDFLCTHTCTYNFKLPFALVTLYENSIIKSFLVKGWKKFFFSFLEFSSHPRSI